MSVIITRSAQRTRLHRAAGRRSAEPLHHRGPLGRAAVSIFSAQGWDRRRPRSRVVSDHR